MARRPIVTFTTDFGHNDHFVGTVKGVILNIVPEVEIVDISHAVQSFDIFEGALTIAQAVVYLASDESRFMTGSELKLDGGISAM